MSKGTPALTFANRSVAFVETVEPPRPLPLSRFVTVNGVPDCETKKPFSDQLFNTALPTPLWNRLGDRD